MAEASRRAARPARKGGLPNAAFILVAAESPPPELCHVAARVTVQFPWGSLLRGCVGDDSNVATGVAGLVAPDGMLELLLAPSARDGLDGVPLAPAALTAAVAGAFASHGLDVVMTRAATEAEIAAAHSTWARRLRSQQPVDRGVMLVRLVRPREGDPLVGGSRNGFVRGE